MTANERNPSYFNSKTHSGWSKGAGLRESGIDWNAIGRAYQLSQRTLGESAPWRVGDGFSTIICSSPCWVACSYPGMLYRRNYPCFLTFGAECTAHESREWTPLGAAVNAGLRTFNAGHAACERAFAVRCRIVPKGKNS